jgi:hypothetical protein
VVREYGTPLSKCGYLLPKDEGAKSLLPFEVYRCRNCGDGLLIDMATKQAFLVPKSLGLFGMTLEKIKRAIKKIPYDEDY